jgi:metal-sulfur cluster biosynthetic enzyme
LADRPYEERTESVEQKLALLQQASAAGNHDLALSLAESIKDTLSFSRQRERNPGQPHSAADHFVPVAELPAAWKIWAEGWSFCKPLALFETIGVERKREPVDLLIAFRPEQISDPAREVRVARVDATSGMLTEITSQVHDLLYHKGQLFCRVVFLADVALHDRSTYLVFYGNKLAELPNYTTDLRVRGEGYGLEIENRHFTAQLSQQMGQLERLTYKHEHGLELFAGGKGHGEPPGIDWGHDYVDTENFQKIRMRNWDRCPNYEVTRGPLCVKVRRWGFPHSPLHPVYAPSRMHMDQTYVFYAGLPYFIKEASFDMIRDFEIDAMRDDEWVFSGYSFTDQVWIDRQGHLHEGKVSDNETNDLWGVGFYHRESRDAFIALWLEHTARDIDGVQHNASPSLHYESHGQIWSRYPLRKTKLAAGSSLHLRNAYLTSPWPTENAAGQIESLRHQLLHPLQLTAETVPQPSVTKAQGTLARSGETVRTAPLKAAIWNALSQVRDEQLYQAAASIVDLGYVYDVAVRNSTAYVLVTMPHRGRPVYEFLVSAGGGRMHAGIREHLLKIERIEEVIVEFTWEPAWTIARMNETGRKAMGL